jgi:hypothetical protein
MISVLVSRRLRTPRITAKSQRGFITPALLGVVAYRRSSGDPDFSSVSLLLHFEGANGSTTVTDSSSYADHKSCNANQSISISQSRFGASSLNITRSSPQGISWGPHARFGRTTSNVPITLEYFFKKVTALNAAASPGHVYWRSQGNTSMVFSVSQYLSGSNISFQVGILPQTILSYTPDANGWNFFQLAVEDSGHYHVYVNGAERANGTASSSTTWMSCDSAMGS